MSNEDKPAPRRIDLRQEGVHWDLGESQSYGEYLQLDKVLDAQKPNSIEQDEMLFIIVHQVSELWMRLFLHELGHVFECVRRDNLDPSFKMLARISRLQEELLGAWSVLSTLTPFEYSAFRNTLGRSSGFQSLQYRLLEFMLGNKNRDVIAVHKRDAAGYERLERALLAPSLYDEVLRFLHRRGHAIPAAVLERDVRQPWRFVPELVPVFARIYEHAHDFWLEYETCEGLVDVEDNFQLWRFRHLKTVERIIGTKAGTGGSSGVPQTQLRPSSLGTQMRLPPGFEVSSAACAQPASRSAINAPRSILIDRPRRGIHALHEHDLEALAQLLVACLH